VRAALSHAAGGAPSLYRGAAAQSERYRRGVESGRSHVSTASHFGTGRKPINVHNEVLKPKSCNELPPDIAARQGAAAAGGAFSIEGICFGDRAGSVELIGQFPGGTLRPAFQEWTNERIVAVMPRRTRRGGSDRRADRRALGSHALHRVCREIRGHA